MTKAFGALVKQKYCPRCGSDDISLASVVTDYDYEMHCNSCGHIWDADVDGKIERKGTNDDKR